MMRITVVSVKEREKQIDRVRDRVSGCSERERTIKARPSCFKHLD